MKAIKFKGIISATLVLIMTVGIFAMMAAAPAAAEDAIYQHFDELSPGTMKFKESTESGYDYVSVTEAYDWCSYYIDMEYLLQDFDIDNYLKKNEKGYVFISNKNYDAKVCISTNGGKNFSDYYPRQDILGVDRYGDDMKADRYDASVCDFSRDNKGSYENICTFGTVALFLRVVESPVTLTLRISTDNMLQNVVYSKKIKIESGSMLDAIKSVDIYDFEFAGKHAATMDTEAWSNVGNVVSIKYLDENKENERTKLMAGDKGYIEFTIAMIRTNIYVDMDGFQTIMYGKEAHWAKNVQSHLKGSAYSGVETNSASFFTSVDNKYVCKFYHRYEIADNDTYVIKQGTIGLTAPVGGAKANTKVTLSNIASTAISGGTRPGVGRNQFTAGDALWLTSDRQLGMKPVTSFVAGNTYYAQVKLEPYGNFYFNDDSVKSLKVPGAKSFAIKYLEAGANAYTREDGWYLTAIFTAKAGSTTDTTPPETTPITTPPVTEPRTPMSLLPVGSQNVVINDPATDFAFEVMAQNATGNVRYMWQACDSNGNVSDPTELSNGQAFLLHGMSMADNGKTYYYKCTAIGGSDIASLVFSVKLELQYFDLKVSYPKTDITVTQGDVATITASTSVDISRATEKTIQWHVAKDQNGRDERDISGADSLTFSIPTGSTGTYYYRCSIGCKLDGKYTSLDYATSPWVKVTVKEKTVTPLTISAVGDKDVILAASGIDYLFQVKTQNATGTVKYGWYACDQNGNVTDSKVLAATDTLVRQGGISEADRDKTLYFKCVATDGKNTASIVCSAILKTKYFDLTIKYNKLDITAAQGESVSVAAQTNIDPALVSDLVIEWWQADNADGKNEQKVAGTGGLTFTVPTTAEGTAYYRCNVTCKRDGEFSRTVYSSAKYVKVTVSAKAGVTTEPPVTTGMQDVTTAAPITSDVSDVTKEPTVDVTTAPEDVTATNDNTKAPEQDITTDGEVTTAPIGGDADDSGATVWVIVGVVAAVLVAAAVVVLMVMKKNANKIKKDKSPWNF